MIETFDILKDPFPPHNLMSYNIAIHIIILLPMLTFLFLLHIRRRFTNVPPVTTYRAKRTMATKRGKLKSIIFNTLGNDVNKTRGEGNVGEINKKETCMIRRYEKK